MKNLILIVTLIMASQSFAITTKLTTAEKAEAKLEALLTLDQTDEVKAEIKATQKQIRKYTREIAIKAKMADKLAKKHNKAIDKEIDRLDKLDLNKKDLCLKYIAMYEREVNEREVMPIPSKTKTKSCYSQYEFVVDDDTIPVVSHDDLIIYFDSKINEMKAAIEAQRM